MKYLCLVSTWRSTRWPTCPTANALAYGESLRERPLRRRGSAGEERIDGDDRACPQRQGVADRRALRRNEGAAQAGFTLIDAKDFDDAIEMAARIPPARVGSIEVRPAWELSAK